MRQKYFYTLMVQRIKKKGRLVMLIWPTVLAIGLLFSCTNAFAQDAEDEDEPHGLYIEKPKLINVGLLVGANFCQIDGDNYAGYRKIGANVGGIGHIRLYKRITFSFELLYSQKGAKSDIVRFSTLDSTTIVTKYGIRLNYAEIPLMINYFDKHKSHFGMGISIGRLLNTSETLETKPPTTLNTDDYPFKKDAYDFVAGADLHLIKGLFLNLRFQYSLLPVRTSSPPGYARAQSQYSNLWTFRVMYLFI